MQWQAMGWALVLVMPALLQQLKSWRNSFFLHIQTEAKIAAKFQLPKNYKGTSIIYSLETSLIDTHINTASHLFSEDIIICLNFGYFQSTVPKKDKSRRDKDTDPRVQVEGVTTRFWGPLIQSNYTIVLDSSTKYGYIIIMYLYLVLEFSQAINVNEWFFFCLTGIEVILIRFLLNKKPLAIRV